jgi:Spy/CpxP family protein refolding chaperone
MKTTPHKIIVPLLSLSLLSISALLADESEETNAPSTNNACHAWHHHHEGGLDWVSLTEQEKEELKADFEKIKNDPQLLAAREAVKAAEKSLHDTRQALILQVDPSAQAILDKLHQGTNAPSAPPAN